MKTRRSNTHMYSNNSMNREKNVHSTSSAWTYIPEEHQAACFAPAACKKSTMS
jgi:hypothetical protein